MDKHVGCLHGFMWTGLWNGESERWSLQKAST
jgi:hypothetical protein